MNIDNATNKNMNKFFNKLSHKEQEIILEFIGYIGADEDGFCGSFILPKEIYQKFLKKNPTYYETKNVLLVELIWNKIIQILHLRRTKR